jgi:NO-binding membrane sensor protein with MHYT domain
MLPVHNFSYGLLTPGLGYVMSVLGCFLGLRCTTRARVLSGSARLRWLLLAAVSIGVTGVWVMHFIAMLGFTIPGETITYNVPVTIFSAVVAVVFVAGGLLIVGFRGDGPQQLLLGGLIIGLGVASMHYIGMTAMRMPAMVHYNSFLILVSVLIAVLAGTAALWAGLHLRGLWSTLGASLIMGVAVSGMHYTGMAAMTVYPGQSAGMVPGATATAFLFPLLIGISVLTVVLAMVVVVSPTDEEIQADAALNAQVAALDESRGA